MAREYTCLEPEDSKFLSILLVRLGVPHFANVISHLTKAIFSQCGYAMSSVKYYAEINTAIAFLAIDKRHTIKLE